MVGGGIVQAFTGGTSGRRHQGKARVSPAAATAARTLGLGKSGESRYSSRSKDTTLPSTFSGSISTSSFLSARTGAGGDQNQDSTSLRQTNISSASTSTSEAAAEGRGETEEPAYSERYLKGQGESPSMISQARLAAASTSARRGLTQDASGAASHWGWTGRLVARILPTSFNQYEAAKPKWAIDPAQLEGGIVRPVANDKVEAGDTQTLASVLERHGSEGICSDVLSLAPADEEGRQYDLSGSRGESDLFVTLDVFLFRRYIPPYVNIQRSLHGSNRSTPSISEGDGSDAGSIGSNTSSEEKDDQLLFIHMRREAEEAAPRTLRRLELSTEKKMQTITHKRGRGKSQNKARKDNIAGKNVTSSSSIVVKASAIDDWNDETQEEMSLSGLTNAELWRKILYDYDVSPDERGRVGISVLNPDAEEGSSDSRIHLDVVSCPPTILRVQVFEDFEARVWYCDGEIVLQDAKCYTPQPEDIGKSLSVLIVPTRPGHDGRGCEEAYRFKNVVEQIVDPIREGWTQRTAEERDDLRVLTYNILADLYTSRDVDQHLMYAHCDLAHLMRWRRMPMLMHEILAYQADVICLQEVDASIYHTLLQPVLNEKGYQGYYSNKASTQQEGCAMFWNTSCFEVAHEWDIKTISIRDLFAEHENHLLSGDSCTSGGAKESKQLSKWNSMDEILDLMGKHDELRRIAREKTGQILQIATLTLKNPRDDDAANTNVSLKPRKMILANTHLFYHPMADHIRAMQAYVVCKKIDEVRRQDNLDPYPLVFCGDLNSDPMSGAVQLLFTRALLPDHHETWKHLHDYCWEMGDNEYMIEHGYIGNEETTAEDPVYVEETFKEAHEDEASLDDDSFSEPFHPPPIVLPSSFPNLVSGCPDMPEFTNFAVDFVETLDYVLASETSKNERYGFKPRKAAPMPNADEIERYIAMPNEFMPSDHVSVVCDLEWTTNEKEAT
eukprot:CAMPEP_0178531410 /NCGR_PEP_ID=MMETSP0696-20121128/33411_1 /TAXON_ID=265572 /ORGANISM="Extubocellulus spinifer, Strain CCMP396" /LENGTH=954 /DNA_ID=CAMNT_0020163309 /DNA_START=339 /DNA_END=3203 /DNA_ORIENTATION=-